MGELSARNFGILIAFVIPGFGVVVSLPNVSDVVRSWVGATVDTAPTVGGFLYVTLASIGAGVTISAVRWLLLDSVHHATGIQRPPRHFEALNINRTGMTAMIDLHYRYYQFYGNSLIALLVAVINWRSLAGLINMPPLVLALALTALAIVLFVGSRDTLSKYYGGMRTILGDDGHK